MTVRVLGIDPGLNRTGYAVIDFVQNRVVLREGGVIRSKADVPLEQRLHELSRGIREVLAEWQPEAAAVEQVFSHVEHPRTAILMGHARGALLLAIAESGLPLGQYAPRHIKLMLTGSGRAVKEQVQLAVQRELALEKVLEPNDVADAAAIAITHLYRTRRDPLGIAG